MINKYSARFFLCIMFCLLPYTVTGEDSYEGWKQIQTEHIQIIFEPRDEAYAQEISAFADETVKELALFLGHLPEERIPVILVGRTAIANGYYTPFPHSITLFLTSPSNRFLGSRTGNWLYSLFVHELAHYIHLTARDGPARFLAPIFGPDITAMNTIWMPGWWIEGIATYIETEYAPGGRGEAPLFELTYTVPIMEDAMWSLWQSGYQSAFPPSGRIYTSGYIFVDYLIDRFGPEIFSRINTRLLQFPFFGLSYAIKQETGIGARELFEDMIKEISQTVSQDDVHRPGVPFSPDTVGNYYLPLPTEKGWIGWAWDLDTGGAVRHYHEPESLPRILQKASISDSFSFDITPDGSTAAAASVETDRHHRANLPNDAVSYSNIYYIDIREGKAEKITEEKRLFHPAVSPDGSRIIAIEAVGPRFRLVEIDPAAGGISPLYDNPEGSVYEPRFSPDGKYITAVEVIDGNSALVYLCTETESTEPLWSHAREEIRTPRFASDGSILFSSDRSGPLALYRIDPETGKTQLVLEDPAGVIGADILGEELIYSTYTSKGYSLRKMHTHELTPETAELPNDQPENEHYLKETAGFESSKYRDVPKLGLWLPLPYQEGTSLNPGAWIMMQSILGKHAFQAAAGWNISEALPLAELQYMHYPGWGSLLLSGRVNALNSSTEQRYHRATAVFSAPIWHRRQLDSSEQVTAGASLSMSLEDSQFSWSTAGEAKYSWSRHAPRAAYYGDASWSIGGGTQLTFSPDSDTFPEVLTFAQTGFQVPLPGAHHILRTDFSGRAFMNYEREGDTFLLPRGNPSWGKPEEVTGKLRATILYRLPFGLFDLPIPFGGITAAGGTVFAQSAWYTGAEHFWEQDVYAGAEVSLDISLRGLATLRPTAGVNFRLFEKDFSFYFDIGLSSLFVGGEDQGTDDKELFYIKSFD